MRPSAIRKEMSAKTGIYCVIYDSACLRKEVNESRKKAGAPPLQRTENRVVSRSPSKPKRTIKTSMSSDPSSCCETTSDGSPLFDMEWERGSSGWKIVAIPYL